MPRGLHLLLLGTAFLSQMVHAKGIEEAIGIQERVQRFVGVPNAYRSLLSYQQDIGTTGKTLNQPWSGSYWALYQGSVAYAYADRGGRSKRFEANLDRFNDRMDRIQRRLKRDVLNSDDIDELSPTEKYDLYLGDTNFSFTKSMWQSLIEQEKNSITKKIADWEGICHGWSGAAAYSKRPVKKVNILSLDGKRTIPFYPHDLKALSSILWANSLIQDYTLVEGLRCKTNNPARDYGSGKVVTTRCKGVNPGVWHLGVMGMVGQRKLPFIINKNNDAEVWNQPMSDYSFDYFNVNTGAKGKLEDVALTLGATNDPFKGFRAKGTAYIVGVDMKANYISETDPNHKETDSPADDNIETLHIRYDLELDAAFNVLGGEWVDIEQYGSKGRYIPDYPGFMWRFQSDYPLANSIGDASIPNPGTPEFTRNALLPASIQANQFRYDRYRIKDDGDYDVLELDEKGQPILSHHELRPQPLGKIVNYLLDLAQ